MRWFNSTLVFILVLITVYSTLPVMAQQGTAQPSQAGINELLARLEVDYGITPAFPAEWQAQNAGEIIQLYNYLTVIYTACDQIAWQLWQLNNTPSDFTPSEHFRFYFDPAHLQIDRALSLNGYAGNTAPRHENGQIAGYLIQLAPLGMSQPFTFAHEIGHVVDSMLDGLPHEQHIAVVGGVEGTTGWIPGEGYVGNELKFPRAIAGPNEDFADTFGQMMVNGLNSTDSTALRYQFMLDHTHQWFTLIRIKRIFNR
jgi:hypothetical protein